MKKILLGILLLSLFACSSNRVNETQKKQKLKTKKEKKIKNDITLNFNVELPESSFLRTKNKYENLLIVYAEKSRGAYIVASGVRSYANKTYKFKSKILKDSDVSKEDLLNSNLVLVGNSRNNVVLKELEKYLPIIADGDKVVIKNYKTYETKDYGVSYFYPNLYNLNNSMIIISGNSDESLKFYDFKESDILLNTKTKEITTNHYKEFMFANFDEKWKLKDIKEIESKELKTGEEEKIKLSSDNVYGFPEWAKGKVIYEIFLRSFYDSDGDGKGDLKGLSSKMDYLEELGVDIIWLTPVFESPSYHGYDVKNYEKIDPTYGTNEDLFEMVRVAHEKGIGVLLDLPLNHTSNKERHFRDAYGNSDSEYDRWFYFSNIKNTIYHDWYFRDNERRRETISSKMPAWNTNNPDVLDYHIKVAKYWMDPNGDGDSSDGVDGYRLDYVKGVSHDYWKEFRNRIKQFNSDTLLVGEVWIDLEEMKPFFDNELDTVFDFTFQGSMTSGVIKDTKETLLKQQNLFPKGTQFSRFMSNHDLDRFPNYIPVPRLKVFASMIYTLNGLPTLYYGDEIGLKGDGEDGDRGRRTPMEWYKNNEGNGMTRWTALSNEAVDGISVEEQKNLKDSLFNHYKKLAKIRKENFELFKSDNLNFIDVMQEKEGIMKKARRVLVYSREENDLKAIIVLNFGKPGIYEIEIASNLEGNYEEALTGKKIGLNLGKNNIELEEFSSNIFIIEN